MIRRNSPLQVETHPAAKAEMVETFRFYRERRPRFALTLRRQVRDAIRSIAEMPHTWPAYLHGTQRLVIRQTRYSVIYRNVGSRVQIIALAHSSRRPGYWRERLED